MNAALPPESWLLILLSVGLGLALELAFLRAQRGRRASGGEAAGDADRGGPHGGGSGGGGGGGHAGGDGGGRAAAAPSGARTAGDAVPGRREGRG